jgi:hypothetical protein
VLWPRAWPPLRPTAARVSQELACHLHRARRVSPGARRVLAHPRLRPALPFCTGRRDLPLFSLPIAASTLQVRRVCAGLCFACIGLLQRRATSRLVNPIGHVARARLLLAPCWGLTHVCSFRWTTDAGQLLPEGRVLTTSCSCPPWPLLLPPMVLAKLLATSSTSLAALQRDTLLVHSPSVRACLQRWHCVPASTGFAWWHALRLQLLLEQQR